MSRNSCLSRNINIFYLSSTRSHLGVRPVTDHRQAGTIHGCTCCPTRIGLSDTAVVPYMRTFRYKSSRVYHSSAHLDSAAYIVYSLNRQGTGLPAPFETLLLYLPGRSVTAVVLNCIRRAFSVLCLGPAGSFFLPFKHTTPCLWTRDYTRVHIILLL